MNFAIGGVGEGLAMGAGKALAGMSAAQGGQSGAAATRHTHLVKAAQEFEASLMQEMLKPMRAKEPLFAEGDSDSDQDGGVLQSFGTQAMAEAIAKGGGMGIAKQVVQQVERQRASMMPADEVKVGAK